MAFRLRSIFQTDIRGYWYEWGVAEGLAGDAGIHRAADAWLQGLSLADHLKPAPITPDQVKMSCAGLGVAFGKLAEPRPDCPFARARRVATYLGRLTDPDPTALGYFDRYDREADQIGTPHPEGIDEAIDWLQTAAAQAGREIQDPFLKRLLKPEHVSFTMLRQFLKPAPAATRARLVAPPAKPAESVKPLQLRSDLEERIQAGIVRVLEQAWKGVPVEITEEERFRIARRNASKIISTLSPHIRRQVGAYFETKKWEPLKAATPKN